MKVWLVALIIFTVVGVISGDDYGEDDELDVLLNGLQNEVEDAKADRIQLQKREAEDSETRKRKPVAVQKREPAVTQTNEDDTDDQNVEEDGEDYVDAREEPNPVKAQSQPKDDVKEDTKTLPKQQVPLEDESNDEEEPESNDVNEDEEEGSGISEILIEENVEATTLEKISFQRPFDDEEHDALLNLTIQIRQQVDNVFQAASMRMQRRVTEELFNKVEKKEGCFRRPYNQSITKAVRPSVGWLGRFQGHLSKCFPGIRLYALDHQDDCRELLQKRSVVDVWDQTTDKIQLDVDGALFASKLKACSSARLFLRVVTRKKKEECQGLIVATPKGLVSFFKRPDVLVEDDLMFKRVFVSLWRAMYDKLGLFASAQFLHFKITFDDEVRSVSVCSPDGDDCDVESVQKTLSKWTSCVHKECDGWRTLMVARECTLWFPMDLCEDVKVRPIKAVVEKPTMEPSFEDEIEETKTVKKDQSFDAKCQPVKHEEEHPIMIPVSLTLLLG